MQEPTGGVRVVRVETSDAAWAGVAARDSGRDSTVDFQRTMLLLGGDSAALVAFAAIGRASHGESLWPLELLSTAGPFLGAWLAAAPLAGGFSDAARGSQPGPAALEAAKSWAVGIPAGLALRALLKGQLPPVPFVLVTLLSTGVLLVGWRTALAALTPARDVSAAGRKSKQGTPLEFLQLLQGLTKRW